MNSIDHNKLLKKIAREQLKKAGIIQQGQSRSFIQDNGWYNIIIEFQPSAWSKGTHLNIGIDFNFYPRENFAFEYESRQKNFVEFRNQEQFEQIIKDFCNFSIKKVDELNFKFQSFNHALKVFNAMSFNNDWNCYILAVLNGINGNFDLSRQLFNKILANDCKFEWQVKRNEQIDTLMNSLKNSESFKEKIIELISETRQIKKLPKVDLGEFEIKTNRKSVIFQILNYFKLHLN